MSWRRTLRSLLWLEVVAFIAALAWRAEVEWHGWAGLLWTRYFHWAVPCGLAAFIAWATLAGEGTRERWRLLLPLVLAAAATPLMFWTEQILRDRFPGAPMLVPVMGGPESFAAVIRRAEVLSVAPVAPAVVAAIARLFGVRWIIPRFLLCAALWYLAWPAAVMALQCMQFPWPDEIHAVKTGSIVPFLVTALGALFIPLPASSPAATAPSARRGSSQTSASGTPPL